jgi:hypothetical protein
VPTFPKARYVFADKELAHRTEAERQDPSAAPWITDSVLPIIAAQRQEVVTSAHQFNDVVQLVSTPRHTVDHYSGSRHRKGRIARFEAHNRNETGRAACPN